MSRLASTICRLPVGDAVGRDRDHHAVGEQAGWNGTVGEGVRGKLVRQISVAMAGGKTGGREGDQEAAENLGAEGLGKETSIRQR